MATKFTSSLAAGLLSVFVLPAWSASLGATATDKSGAPMSDVVIYATPVGAHAPLPATKETAVIAQQDMQFSPYVTPLRVGSQISFPNNDKMAHHVKSFSPAKEFEFKIYDSKATPPPVVFDKTGVVIVYCILHDSMRAYVMVVDTPYFAKTSATGAVNLTGLPAGSYEIRAWHPDMGAIKPPLLQTVTVAETANAPLVFDFNFLPKKRKMMH